MSGKKQKLYLAVTIAIGLLLCACSGGESGNGNGDSEPLSGRIVDSPVEGISYQTATRQGTTDASGSFSYSPGETVDFSIGCIDLGQARATSLMTPLDLVPQATSLRDPAVTNMLRLLQSLDEDDDPTNGILIPPATTDAANGSCLSTDMTIFEFENYAALADLIDQHTGGHGLVDSDTARQHYYESVCTEYRDELKSAALLTTSGEDEPNIAVHADGSRLVILPGEPGDNEQERYLFTLASGGTVAVATDLDGRPYKAVVDDLRLLFGSLTGETVDVAAAFDDTAIGVARIELPPAGRAFYRMVVDDAPASRVHPEGGGSPEASRMRRAVASLGLLQEVLGALEKSPDMEPLSAGGTPFTTRTATETRDRYIPGYTIAGGYADWSGWSTYDTSLNPDGATYTTYVKVLADYRRSIGEPVPEGFLSHEQAISAELNECAIYPAECSIELPYLGGEGLGCETTETQQCRQAVYIVGIYYNEAQGQWQGSEETVTEINTRDKEPDTIVPGTTETSSVEREVYASGDTGWGYRNRLDSDPGLQLWLRGFRQVTDFNGDPAAAQGVALGMPGCNGQNSLTGCADALHRQATQLYAPAGELGQLWLDPAMTTALEQGLADATFHYQAPAVRISSPLDGETFGSGSTVTLEGSGLDAQDGTAVDLMWSSDRDGELGAGASLALDRLSEGWHIITLRGVDSEGDYSEARISIGYGGTYNLEKTFNFSCNP